MIELRDYQKEAVRKLKNGCILNGGVGSGKSLTALYYFFTKNGGSFDGRTYMPMDDISMPDLYIITTAMKRDKHEWDKELAHFLLTPDRDISIYSHKVKIDSWNNIQKYREVKGAFFIFDEQRVIGKGAWVKSFLKITKSNEWILLSATPGDTWSDYIPVFIANGFYKNRTEFEREHCVYSRFTKYPKIEKYVGEGKLQKLRKQILVNMDFERKTCQHHEDLFLTYDILAYKDLMRKRWNNYENKPIESPGELCYLLRKVVNSDESRGEMLLEVLEDHERAIVFYNYDYELDILKNLMYPLGTKVAEWNGHKHDDIPKGTRWVYLVQYSAGNEGWNCLTTDTIIFYSENYSYRIMTQAAGRIDRMNTPFTDLYYYHFKTHSGIDLAIARALKAKKNFNEKAFVGGK